MHRHRRDFSDVYYTGKIKGNKNGREKGFFSRLVSGLTKTRKNIASGLDAIFSGFSKIDDEFYEELEEILIMGDLGVGHDHEHHRESAGESKRRKD